MKYRICINIIIVLAGIVFAGESVDLPGVVVEAENTYKLGLQDSAEYTTTVNTPISNDYEVLNTHAIKGTGKKTNPAHDNWNALGRSSVEAAVGLYNTIHFKVIVGMQQLREIKKSDILIQANYAEMNNFMTNERVVNNSSSGNRDLRLDYFYHFNKRWAVGTRMLMHQQKHGLQYNQTFINERMDFNRIEIGMDSFLSFIPLRHIQWDFGSEYNAHELDGIYDSVDSINTAFDTHAEYSIDWSDINAFSSWFDFRFDRHAQGTNYGRSVNAACMGAEGRFSLYPRFRQRLFGSIAFNNYYAPIFYPGLELIYFWKSCAFSTLVSGYYEYPQFKELYMNTPGRFEYSAELSPEVGFMACGEIRWHFGRRVYITSEIAYHNRENAPLLIGTVHELYQYTNGKYSDICYTTMIKWDITGWFQCAVQYIYYTPVSINQPFESVAYQPEHAVEPSIVFHTRSGWQWKTGLEYQDTITIDSLLPAEDSSTITEHLLLHSRMSVTVGKVLDLFLEGNNLMAERYSRRGGYSEPQLLLKLGIRYSMNTFQPKKL